MKTDTVSQQFYLPFEMCASITSLHTRQERFEAYEESEIHSTVISRTVNPVAQRYLAHGKDSKQLDLWLT